MKISKHIITSIILILFLSILVSCTTRYTMNVDSISEIGARNKSKYIILSGDEKIDINDLQFKEFVFITENILSKEGFIKVFNIEDADVAILLNYGRSDPQIHQYTYSVPVYGQTGFTSRTTGFLNTHSNSATYSSNTSCTPTYGVVGSRTEIGTSVLYLSYLFLSGFDLEKYKTTFEIADAKEIWSVKVSNISENGDFRKMFPILLVASQQYIANSTRNAINITLAEDDDRILSIFNTIPQNNNKTLLY